MIDDPTAIQITGLLLAIFGVFFGGVGVGLYKMLSWQFQKETKETTEKTIKLRNAELYKIIGYNYWATFDMERDKKTKIDESLEAEYKKNLTVLINQAIEITQNGLDECKELDEKESEKILGDLKNNYAWYVKEMDNPTEEQKRKAMKFVDDLDKIYTKYSVSGNDWIDTIDQVRKEFKK